MSYFTNNNNNNINTPRTPVNNNNSGRPVQESPGTTLASEAERLQALINQDSAILVGTDTEDEEFLKFMQWKASSQSEYDFAWKFVVNKNQQREVLARVWVNQYRLGEVQKERSSYEKQKAAAPKQEAAARSAPTDSAPFKLPNSAETQLRNGFNRMKLDSIPESGNAPPLSTLNSSFGTFGSTATAPSGGTYGSTTPPSGGSFGNTTPTASAPPGGGFGNATPSASAAGGGGSFGNTGYINTPTQPTYNTHTPADANAYTNSNVNNNNGWQGGQGGTQPRGMGQGGTQSGFGGASASSSTPLGGQDGPRSGTTITVDANANAPDDRSTMTMQPLDFNPNGGARQVDMRTCQDLRLIRQSIPKCPVLEAQNVLALTKPDLRDILKALHDGHFNQNPRFHAYPGDPRDRIIYSDRQGKPQMQRRVIHYLFVLQE